MDIALIISIIVCLILSGFFSGMEIAFVSSNRMLLEIDKDRAGLSKKCISAFYDHPNGFVSTMLVGNNIILVVYAMLVARLLDATLFSGMSPAFTVPADSVLSTVIVLFTGEFLPKILFRNNANRYLAFFAPIAYFFYIVLWPISRFATFLANCMLRIFRLKTSDESDDEGFSRVDLDYLVQSSIDSAPDDKQIDDEVKIFHAALDFSDTKVRDCMVPRTEIVAVDINTASTDELRQLFVESGHSKAVVYDADIDHVVGYIHSSEMFHDAAKWHDAINTMPFVPETMSAQKLMQAFLAQKKSLAIVVDEFGGTSGVVALEDIVEEIFGDIEDEHDTNQYTARKNQDGSYTLSARLEIDKANELFPELELPEADDYMTIGGMILKAHQNIPKVNQTVDVGRLHFKIIKSSQTKIELVELSTSKAKE